MTIEVVDWVFEERVKRYLVKWIGGDNLTPAAKVITEMAKEAAATAY